MEQDTMICHLNTFPNHYNRNHLQIQYNIQGFSTKNKNSHIDRNAYAHPVAVASIEIQAKKIFTI